MTKWQRHYEQETREGKKPLTRFVRSDFRKALLCTAVPIVVLSLISLAGAGTYMYKGLQLIWFGAVGLLVLAILAAIVLLITGRRQIAAGIFAGIGIGIVSLGVTCFANVNLARYG